MPDLERITSELSSKVEDLSGVINLLNSTVAEQRKVIESYETSIEASINEVSVEQEQISNNIVIRGLEVHEDTPESTLKETFERICDHIGIERSACKPISAELLPCSTTSKTRSNRPFIVRLESRTHKQKFLQARRIKRDIRPSEIQHEQRGNRPLIITEQLTKENQKLFLEARSLRTRGKFKFVWTHHGQILARQKKRSPVIRIRNLSDVEHLGDNFRIHDHARSERTNSSYRNSTQE